MNQDQLKGQLKDIAGRVQAEGAKLVGSTRQHAKGCKLQDEGKAQKSLGDARQRVKETRQAVNDALSTKT